MVECTGEFRVKLRGGEGYVLRYLMGLFSIPLGSTRANRMEIDSKETGGNSVKNFPTLGAALVGGELPVPGSMQVKAGESLEQDAERDLSPPAGRGDWTR